MTKRPRLDELLVSRGLFDNVHDAQAAVLAGEVVVGEHRETSAGLRVDPKVPVRLKRGKEKDRLGFVSRGGGKLEAALEAFSFEVAGLSCADLGCSSGGFTDCLLQHGAVHVSAVDVGHADFDWSLRQDARVSLYERTNVIGLAPEAIGGPFDLVVADLSFVSLARASESIASLVRPGGSFIGLVKPQFELAKSEVGQGGVVTDEMAHERAIEHALSALTDRGLYPCGLTYSPLKGPKGNIEFLCWAKRAASKGERQGSIYADDVSRVVRAAHARLD